MTEHRPGNLVRWLFDSRRGPPDRLVPRWIFLRALAAIYFSAFFSLLFQIKGLIGPVGILPAGQYLAAVARTFGRTGYWFAPSLFWLSAGSHALMAVMGIGLAASVLAFLNLWPRLNFFICFVCFLSFVAAAQEFSGYQSDGMLLEAGFLALFFAPSGVWPGWGAASPPSRASLFLLQWEWFRIYFESGLVKLLSGDREWRTLRAMDEYYQNSPLPTWIGWYVEHLPRWFQTATAAGTLGLELGVVLLLFFPRRVRLVCFCIVTPWEIGVILTGNYAFLNYLVLALGFLLLDDRTLRRFVPSRLIPVRWRRAAAAPVSSGGPVGELLAEERAVSGTGPNAEPAPALSAVEPTDSEEAAVARGTGADRGWFTKGLGAVRLALVAGMLLWIAYVTAAKMARIVWRDAPVYAAPIAALQPFRIANQYGLFAVMTRGRYEIEFQGSDDGQHWTPYLFRYKPQLLNEAPGIYAPYQPRFDWNLWFASLGSWQQDQIVPITEERLLANDGDVLALFQGNPFGQSPPRFVRAVLWQYWFTSKDEKRRTGNWWRRQRLGLYAPEIGIGPNGSPAVIQWADELPPHD